jgi:hypothetical protein
MTQLHTQHWHAAVTYPGYQDGYDDRPFEDIDNALDYANQARDAFLEDGHSVTEVDRPEDDVSGVIQRYQAAEEEAATVAAVEVRPCHAGGCLPGRSFDFLPVDVAESCPTHMLDPGVPKRGGRGHHLELPPGRPTTGLKGA